MTRNRAFPGLRLFTDEPAWVSLAIAAKPDSVDGGFWRAVLGYTGVTDVSAVDPTSRSLAST
jgi:hypothetical protein